MSEYKSIIRLKRSVGSFFLETGQWPTSVRVSVGVSSQIRKSIGDKSANTIFNLINVIESSDALYDCSNGMLSRDLSNGWIETAFTSLQTERFLGLSKPSLAPKKFGGTIAAIGEVELCIGAFCKEAKCRNDEDVYKLLEDGNGGYVNGEVSFELDLGVWIFLLHWQGGWHLAISTGELGAVLMSKSSSDMNVDKNLEMRIPQKYYCFDFKTIKMSISRFIKSGKLTNDLGGEYVWHSSPYLAEQ